MLLEIEGAVIRRGAALLGSQARSRCPRSGALPVEPAPVARSGAPLGEPSGGAGCPTAIPGPDDGSLSYIVVLEIVSVVIRCGAETQI